MAKLLNTTFLVTQSSPTTPSSGFGTLFASSSKLFFKNSSGTTYDLTTGGSGGGYINILTYTGSGTYTYNTGSGVQYIKVVCAGAGGGGGSGRINPIGTRGGGGGGAGGNINIAYFSSQSLIGNTYTVRIGGGGPGATRVASNILTNGSPGFTGISSSFSTGSTILLWGGGGPGGGAGIGAAAGGTNTAPSTANTPNPYPPFYYSGVNGATGNTGAIPTPAGNALSGTRTLAGGGAGGSLTGTTYSGGSGSAIYDYNILVQSGSPSLSSSGLPGDNGAPVIDIASLLFYSGSNITTGVRIGTGGHGGGGGGFTAVGPSGGSGGSGSLGAGGGGGGAAVTSSISFPNIQNGGGGRGGDGFVLIFEYY
jgi:hypothetical protein